MARKYRVIHQKKALWEAMIAGRKFTDWYIAQYKGWVAWRSLGVFNNRDDAEQACEHHAGGHLLPDGTRIISEFERPDED